MYKIKSFFKRLRKGLSWGVFMFKSTPWSEYDELLRILEKQLLTMAIYFEKKDFTISAQHNAKRMRLAAKLLKMYRVGYYQNKYSEEHWVNDVLWTNAGGRERYGGYDSTHSIQGMLEAEKKDEKVLRIAMLIIGKDLPRWWM